MYKLTDKTLISILCKLFSLNWPYGKGPFLIGNGAIILIIMIDNHSVCAKNRSCWVLGCLKDKHTGNKVNFVAFTVYIPVLR